MLVSWGLTVGFGALHAHVIRTLAGISIRATAFVSHTMLGMFYCKSQLGWGSLAVRLLSLPAMFLTRDLIISSTKPVRTRQTDQCEMLDSRRRISCYISSEPSSVLGPLSWTVSSSAQGPISHSYPHSWRGGGQLLMAFLHYSSFVETVLSKMKPIQQCPADKQGWKECSSWLVILFKCVTRRQVFIAFSCPSCSS